MEKNMIEWLAYAVGAMLLFSAANVILKSVLSHPGAQAAETTVLAFAAIAVIVMLAAAYFLGYVKVSQQVALLALAFIVIAAVGFALMLKAFADGKAAVVTAVLSLSTVAVAILSYLLLGDRFSSKEIIAMALATASLIALVV